MLFLAFTANLAAQTINDSIPEEYLRRTVEFLSSDKLGGRVNYSRGQLQAAAFIYAEFEKLKLTPYPGLGSFLHYFQSKQLSTGENKSENKKVSWKSLAGDSIHLHADNLYNLVAVLPGKSIPGEAIIFSAHYDHIREFGGIYNGANDNASGTAAVLALAQYFALRNDNARTLIFCLFAGEELGLLGSKAFVEHVNPDSIVAVLNIEMIGLTNATGKNGFFVTGPGHSGVYDILKKNVKNTGSKFRVIALKNDRTNLYERSDNYPFALKGIPAHSIMCSDDDEACYHQPCDDFRHIKIENMTNVIRAIAIGASTMISGIDTPERRK